MKHVLTLCFLLTLHYLSAQDFAYIQDSDGYCNVRNLSNLNIIDTQLKNGSLIFCFFDDKNENEEWVTVDYTDTEGKIKSGVVYHNRFFVINETNFKKASSIKISDNVAKISFDTISIIVTKKVFTPTGKTFTYNKEYPDMIELINGKNYYGTDGGMPKTQFASIEISLGNQIINLPTKALENLYEPDINIVSAYFSEDNNTFFIESWNSDGAGTYVVMWRIEKGIYQERAIYKGF